MMNPVHGVSLVEKHSDVAQLGTLIAQRVDDVPDHGQQSDIVSDLDEVEESLGGTEHLQTRNMFRLISVSAESGEGGVKLLQHSPPQSDPLQPAPDHTLYQHCSIVLHHSQLSLLSSSLGLCQELISVRIVGTNHCLCQISQTDVVKIISHLQNLTLNYLKQCIFLTLFFSLAHL